MINSLDIFNSNTNSNGTVLDSVAFGNYVCLVGSFTSVNSVPASSIVLINSVTGELDTTSALAAELQDYKNQFGSTLKVTKVRYEVSNGHPCLIFIFGTGYQGVGGTSCHVFFINEFYGYEFIKSSPLAFSTPLTLQMNSSTYIDMKICATQRALVVIGNFYLKGKNGCVFIGIDSLYGGVQNGSTYAALGTTPTASYNYFGLAIDDASSRLFLALNNGVNIQKYFISSSGNPTLISSFHQQLGGVDTSYSMLSEQMLYSNNKLIIAVSYGNVILILFYSGTSWATNAIQLAKTQFQGSPDFSGITANNDKLYIYGVFTNALYPNEASLSYSGANARIKNKRSSIAVFDISGSTPVIIGKDIALSYGTIYITLTPPPTYFGIEQVAQVQYIHADSSGAYAFPRLAPFAHGTTPDKTSPTNIYPAIFRDGIKNNDIPVKLDLDGQYAQLFDANLLY